MAVHQARADGARRIVSKSGRRWGKTRFGIGDMIEAYHHVLQQHRPESMVPPFHVWLVVPNFPQARQPWNEMQQLIPREWVTQLNPSDWNFWLRGNERWQHRQGFVEVKTAHDPDALQTTGVDYLWIDEAQDVPNEAFEKVLPVSRSPGVLGWQYFDGIPSLYPEHWFERAYREAERNPLHFSHTATSFDNPLLTTIDKAEIESDREVLSNAAWERLYLAQYSENAAFFRNVSQCISGDLLTEPTPGRQYIAGLDVGWTNDPSVFILMDMESRRVVNHWEWDGSVSWVQTREHIMAIHDEWGLKTIIFDASSGGGKAVEEDLMNTGLPVEPFAIVGERRKELLERLAGATERATISFPPIPQLVRQLRAMQMRRLPAGAYRLQVPRGEHDDYIFALALGLTACIEARAPVSTPPRASSSRYVPTQAEVDGHARMRSKGAQIMRLARSERLKRRADMADVER